MEVSLIFVLTTRMAKSLLLHHSNRPISSHKALYNFMKLARTSVPHCLVVSK
jgi:hypothetical protein